MIIIAVTAKQVSSFFAVNFKVLKREKEKSYFPFQGIIEGNLLATLS